MRWLCHPATFVAVIVLVVNDHVLKAAWPGVVTGKLSDVAGLVVAPAVVALFLPRRADLVAVVVVGVGFAVVKCTQTGAELASQGWTLVAGPSQVLADPTDLLALPALGVAWWIRCHPLPVRRAQIICTVPLAAFAVLATSPLPGVPQANYVEVTAEGIIVSGFDTMPMVSADGGATWHARRRQDDLPAREARTSACVGQHCYRVVSRRMKVMESNDGGATWGVSWEVSAGRAKLLDRVLGEPRCCRRRPPESESLAVQARPGGGHVVVVANERDGIAVRGENGTWRRLGFVGAGLGEPTPLSHLGRYVGDETRVAVLTGLWAMIAALVAVSAPGSASSHSMTWLALGGVLLMMPYPYPETFIFTDNPLPWLVAVPGGVMTFTMLVLALARLRTVASVLRPLALGIAVALGIALPFYGWSAGVPDDYGTAVALAVVIGLGVGGAGLRYLIGSSTSKPT